MAKAIQKRDETMPATPNEERVRTAWKLVGAATALEITGGNVARVFSAEAIRAYGRVEDENLYLEMGYPRFVDFLNSDDCFIGKASYYERRDLLNKEGEQLYDLLNGLQVSLRKRKQIGAGNVEIDGETLLFKETNEKVPLSDHKRLIEILDLTVAANAAKAKKLEKGKEDYRRLKEKFLEAEEQGFEHGGFTDLDAAHGIACTAIAALADQLANNSDRELKAYNENSVEILATQYQRLFDTLSDRLGIERSSEEFDL